MGEAMLIAEMEKMQNFLVNKVKVSRMVEMERSISHMKLLVSLVREKKVEGMMSSRLNYMISDVVEVARDALSFYHKLDRLIDASQHFGGYSVDFKDLTYFNISLETLNNRLRDLDIDAGPRYAGFGEGDVVGFEGDVKQLLHKITSMDLSQPHPFGASIEGIAGSGKTTLARQMYDDVDVVRDFETRVWVSCTEILCRKELLVNIVQQLVAKDYSCNDVEEMDSAHLLRVIAQQLHEKRLFIVLDDFCKICSSPYIMNDIRQIFGFLGNTGKGRSIILFTCRTRVIKDCIDYHHDMKPLDVEKSWQLIVQSLSSMNKKLPKKVERKGKAMLMKHTGGLPLAVKEVAMEWAEKQRSGIEWEDVVESEDLELRATLKVIDYSFYQELGQVDSSCFLLLSLFKLGTTIRARKLQQIWVAAGVSPRDRSSLKYLIDLNIIQIKDFTKTGQPKNVCIRPILHKLSIMKAKNGDDDGSTLRIIFCSRKGLNGSMDQNEQLRCVFFNGGGCFNVSPSYWESFKELRVLDFEGFGLKFVPEMVGELIELRYLGLRDNYIQELPHSLGNLKKLEVLDIAHNFMVKVPDIIWEMEGLLYLYMSDILCMKPLRIETLKNLQTLTYISVNNWAYKVSGLHKMTSLCKLGIDELDENSNMSELFVPLATFKGLINLVLRVSPLRSMLPFYELGFLHRLEKLKIDGLIIKLPGPRSFPPNLDNLTLVNSQLDKDPMPVLEKLPHLKYLKIQNAYTGQEMVISDGGFPKLGCLSIGELWHLRNIQVGKGAFVSLQDLEINSCPCLHNLPKEMIIKNHLRLKMVTTKKIAAEIKDWGLSSQLEVDIRP